MAQAFYRPAFKKQLTGTALGGKNCNMAAAAMLTDRDTLGLLSPTSDAMRKASGDTSGGTDQDGAITALAKYGIVVDHYDSTDGKTYADIVAWLRSGRAVSASGLYKVLPYALKGDKDFDGTHQVLFNEWRSDGALLTYDPLDDGRYSGIPKGPIWWPGSEAKQFVEGYPGPWVTCIVARRRRVTPKVDVANVRSGPSMEKGVIAQLRRGAYLARGSRSRIGGAVGTNRVWWPVWVPSIAKIGYMHSSVVSLV
jgi:hypothetical protein